MENDYLRATKQALATHGIDATYTKVVNGTYDVETGSTTKTETAVTVRAYKKHIKASQYNYPALVNKDAALFYIAGDALTDLPAVKDRITYGSATYTIEVVQEHVANGSIALYRLAAVKV